MVSVDQNQLDVWLARLRWRPNFADFPNVDGAFAAIRAEREAAFAAMTDAGADALFPLLIPMLTGDPEARCTACQILMRVDAERGRALVVPLLEDTHAGVRHYACERLAERGGKPAVPELLKILRSHPDPSLRCSAARGLGWQGGPDVIPALLETVASDHEVDDLGYTPSHCASMALDDILGTDETCLHFGNVCRMLDREPDLDRLRRLAEERYRRWQTEAALDT